VWSGCQCPTPHPFTVAMSRALSNHPSSPALHWLVHTGYCRACCPRCRHQLHCAERHPIVGHTLSILYESGVCVLQAATIALQLVQFDVSATYCKQMREPMAVSWCYASTRCKPGPWNASDMCCYNTCSTQLRLAGNVDRWEWCVLVGVCFLSAAVASHKRGLGAEPCCEVK
jgi:hypothetical protein